MDMKGLVERVEKRLEALGLTAAEVSAAATNSKDTIRNWQRAAKGDPKRGAGIKSLEAVARELKTNVRWLVEGIPPEEGPAADGAVPKAQFTGRVGAGGSAIHVEYDPNEAKRLPLIAGPAEGLRIAELDGHSLGVQFDRWLVIYGRPVTFKDDLPYGQLCLVLTTDDEMTVKWLQRTRKKGVKLLDAAGETYRDGVELQWAAPVLGMRPK